MANYQLLKADIDAKVYQNGKQEITGDNLNSVLNAMVTTLGEGYQFMGVATPTNPGTAQNPDYKCFYLATTHGTYNNMGGLVVADGEVAILKYDSAWTKEVTGIATAAQLNQLSRAVEVKVLDKTTVNSRWTPVYEDLPEGTILYLWVKNINTTQAGACALSHGNSWSSQNIIQGINEQSMGIFTTLSVSGNVGLLFYSTPQSYDNVEIWISLSPFWHFIKEDIESVRNENLKTLNPNTARNYLTPLYQGLKKGTIIYYRINSLPDGVPLSQIALVRSNSWADQITTFSDAVVGEVGSIILTETTDVYFRFYNTDLPNHNGLSVDFSLNKIFYEVGKLSTYVGYEDYQLIKVVVNPGDSIRQTINNITDASKKKRYQVLIKNGTYYEIDIVTKSYVDIIGESRDGVKIITNGQSTEISPSDYHFSDYANTPINEIPALYKHLLWHTSSSKVSNLTMIVNDCKYVIHQDEGAGAYTAIVDNCVIKREESISSGYGNLVGCGARHNEYMVYKNCVFVNNVPGMKPGDFPSAVFWHNIAHNNNVCGLTIENCKMFGCNIAYINDLGSEKKDVINILYNETDGDIYGVKIVGTEGKAYNQQIKIDGNPNWIILSDDIMDKYENVPCPYVFCKISVSESVLCGQPIAFSRGIYEQSQITNDGNFVVAAEDIASGAIGVANKGKAVQGLALSGTYVKNQNIYINNGKFTNVANGNPVAISLENATLSTDGLLQIMKLS